MSRPSRHRPRPRRAGLAAVAATAVVAVLTGCAPAVDAAPASPVWHPCPDAAGLQCATIPVPLDHDDPSAGSLDLAVARLPASAPAPDAEPIVLHRGGPGYGNVEYLEFVAAGQLPAPVDDTVRRGHDLIAVDSAAPAAAARPGRAATPARRRAPIRFPGPGRAWLPSRTSRSTPARSQSR